MSITHIRTCDRCPSAPVIEKVARPRPNDVTSDDVVVTVNDVEIVRFADLCSECRERVDDLIGQIALRKEEPEKVNLRREPEEDERPDPPAEVYDDHEAPA